MSVPAPLNLHPACLAFRSLTFPLPRFRSAPMQAGPVDILP